MAHQYRRPPILEAGFEIRFSKSADYNIFTPLRIYEQLASDYPSEPVLISDQGIEIVEDRRDDFETTFRLKREQYRYQLTSPGAEYLLRYNRQILSVNANAPYQGWLAFRQRIHSALDAYLPIAQPLAVERMSVRYINQIGFDEEPVDLSDYFVTAPISPKGSTTPLGAFFQRLEYYWEDSPFRLIQTFASAQLDKQKLGVILDLDLIAEDSFYADALSDDLVNRIDKLREAQRDSFESLITDRLRETFDAT
jgi:uncharacterized protein (TIGR04255 family)